MIVKKLSFYLVDATITLWSDHLSLKQFLQKTMLNAEMYNKGAVWNGYNIKFKFIKRVDNTLVETIGCFFVVTKCVDQDNEDSDLVTTPVFY